MGFERRLTDTLVIVSLLLGLAASLVFAPEDLAASGTDYEEVWMQTAEGEGEEAGYGDNF